MGTFLARVDGPLILPARARLPEGEEHSRRRAGRGVPAPVPLRMLIDTGASRTTLIPGVIRHLQPYRGPETHLNTALGRRDTTLYWVRLDFPEAGLAPFENMQVASAEMPPSLARFHGLIGRDVLRGWDELRYRGRRGRYLIRDAPGLLARLWPWP